MTLLVTLASVLLPLVAHAARVDFTAAALPNELCCGWRPLTAEAAAAGFATSASNSEPSVSFSLTLRERNLDRVQAIALAVSTPGDASYGEHLTRSELDTLTAPLAGSLSRVTAWLEVQDVPSSSVEVTRGRHVKVSGLPIAQARDLLSADFTLITRDGVTSEKTRAFATRYSLPLEIADVVAVVYGLSGVPLPVPTVSPVGAGSRSPAYGPPHVTPAILKKTYNITDDEFANNVTTNKQAIVSFLGQTFSADDLNTFYSTYVSNTTKPPTITCVPPSSCEGGSETEASLDIQYLIGASPRVPTEGWYVVTSER